MHRCNINYCNLPFARLKHTLRSSARLHFISVSGCVIIFMLIPARCNSHKNKNKHKGREASQFYHIQTRNLSLYRVPSKRRPIKCSHILIMWTDNKIHIQAASQLLTKKNSVIRFTAVKLNSEFSLKVKV